MVGVELRRQPPVVVAHSGSVVEGNSGTTTPLNLFVELSAPSGKTVTVRWATIDTLGQPQPGVDYAAASGMLTFAPDETQKLIQIAVIGDNVDEPGSLSGAEWGGIVMSSPTNAVFGAGYVGPVGFALIVDDD